MRMTFKEALSKLQEPYRTQAICNCRTFDLIRSFDGKISEFLIRAFVFENTEQGFDYWHEKLKELEQLGL